MNAVQDLQNKISKLLDVVNEGKWHPESALQALTASIGSIAIAVNVPLEDLLRESNHMLTEMYKSNEQQGREVQ